MGWIIFAIVGAGAARVAWLLLTAYERLASARDELDDSLQEHEAAQNAPLNRTRSQKKP